MPAPGTGAARLTPAPNSSPFDLAPSSANAPQPQASPFDAPARRDASRPPAQAGHEDRPPGAWMPAGHPPAHAGPPHAGYHPHPHGGHHPPPHGGHPPPHGGHHPPPHGGPPNRPPPHGGPPHGGAVVPWGSPAAAPPPSSDVHTEQTRYFVITSNTKDNVIKSLRHSLWATQKKNEVNLDDAFRHSPAVILVFSYHGSDGFQGYARMRSFIGQPRSRHIDPFNRFGKLFDVEWLRLHDLPYREVDHIRNPLNGDRGVRTSRDGQELSNQCGRQLCGLIDRHVDAPESFPVERPRSPPREAPRALQMQPHSGYAASGMPGYAGAYGQGQGLHPATAAITPYGQKQPRASSSDSEGRKKKKKRRKHAPHPLTAGFDEQVEFFVSLDYEEYLSWWRRHAAKSPGPTPPPGTEHLGPPPGPPSMAMGAPPHHAGPAWHVGTGMPPPHGTMPPHHGGQPRMAAAPYQ